MKSQSPILHNRLIKFLVLILIISIMLVGCSENEAQQDKEKDGNGTEEQKTKEFAFGPEIQIGDPKTNPNSPFLRIGPEGKLYASWVAIDDRSLENHNSSVSSNDGMSSHHGHGDENKSIQAAYVAHLSQNGESWSEPIRLNEQVKNIEGEEGLPKIAFGNKGQLYATYSTPSDEKYRNDVQFVQLMADGSVTSPVTMNDTPGVARFPNIAVSPNGDVFVPWIDRRVDNPAPRVIYYTRMDETGKVLDSNVKVANSTSCECCRDAIAFAGDGKTVYVAYRHKTEDNIRDIAVQTSTDGGKTFGEPVIVSHDNWFIEQCPHSGPVIATDGQGNLHVTWFTRGEKLEDAGLYYSVSKDGGKTFEPRKLLANVEGPGVLHSHLAVSENGDAYIAWDNLLLEENKTEIFFRHLSADGDMSPVQQLSAVDGNAVRPNLVVLNSQIYVSWTESKGDSSWIVMRAASRQ